MAKALSLFLCPKDAPIAIYNALESRRRFSIYWELKLASENTLCDSVGIFKRS